MSAAREALRETRLVLQHELAEQVRSARAIIFALLNAVVPALIGIVYFWVGDKLLGLLQSQTLDAAQVVEAKKQFAEKLADFVFGDIFLGDYIAGLPWLVVLVFFISGYTVPLFSFLMTFDVVASEVTSRSVRFDLLRARRSSYYAGKVLAHGVIVAATSLVLFGVATAYAARADDFDWASGLLYALRCWALLSLHGTACVALTIFISIIFARPALSLLLGAFIWAVLFVVHLRQTPWVGELAPFSHLTGLLHPVSTELWLAVAFYVVFIPVAIVAGQLVFARRDV